MNNLTLESNSRTSLFDADQFSHWLTVSKQLAVSDMIPKNYKNKPMDILVAMEMGKQVGLSMIQALQNIAVVNGRPCMYGDGLLAVCQSHPDYEYMKEEPILKNDSINGYKCTVKRKNHDEHTVFFTVDDAKKASLWDKVGPWKQYPSRMLQMRARGFALRDTFADALQGIQLEEEIQDYPIRDITPKQSQNDKLQSLLIKKGFNNENHVVNSISDNKPNAIDSSGSSNSQISNSISTQHSETTENGPWMDETRESKDIVEDTKVLAAPCTESQLESIGFLIHEKAFNTERVTKALLHFGVSCFEEFTYEQADEMIKILNKVE